MGSYSEFLWTPLPSPTFSLLTGQWLDFHQLADYHASRTALALTRRAMMPLLNRALPFVRAIAAGKPIETLETISYMTVPDALKTDKPCYVLQVKGDSMIEAGIYDGDWVVIEQRDYASNGEIVVALIENFEATLKYIEQRAGQVLLLPANAHMSALSYRPEQVAIQGVLVGQMRSYRSH